MIKSEQSRTPVPIVGDTAFILGNGPSLRAVDLELFSGVATLGMNVAYRHWERVDWYPTHYCCLDEELIATHHAAIYALLTEGLVETAFLTARILEFHPDLADHERCFFRDSFSKGLYERRGKKLGLPFIEHPAFQTSAPSKVTTGAYAIRYAVFCGYSRLYLLGIDCNYVEVVPEARSAGGLALEMVSTPDSNPNYFFDDYQQAGDRYNVPNPAQHDGNLHLQSVEAVRDDIVAQRLPVQIRTCSKASKLTSEGVLPYEDLDKALGRPLLGAVAVPMTFAEEEALLENFRLWDMPERVPAYPGSDWGQVPLVLILNGGRDLAFEARVKEAFERHELLATGFSGLEFRYCRLTAEEDRYERDPGGEKSGPNTQFLRGMSLLADYGRYVFMMETDCLPVRPNWLGELQCLVSREEPFWVLGSLYRGVDRTIAEDFRTHINGNAVYAVGDTEFQAFVSDVWKPALDEIKERVPSIAYDCVFPLYFTEGRAAPEGSKWTDYQRVAARFRYTEYIQNHASRAEIDRGEGLPLEEILDSSPRTFVVHGRHFFPSVETTSDGTASTGPDAELPVPVGGSGSSTPRLLVIDPTRVNSSYATGKLKGAWLADWPESEFLQVYGTGKQPSIARTIEQGNVDVAVSTDEALDEIARFMPDVIYYRPTIDTHPELHSLALEALDRHSTALVSHIMDDWPARLAREDAGRAREVDTELRSLFHRSDAVLSISEKMSTVFEQRYGVPFEPLANGVDPEPFRSAAAAAGPAKQERDELILRYAGALAADMTFESVLDVAKAIDTLQGEAPVRLEVYTWAPWKARFEKAVAGLRGVDVLDGVFEPDRYPELLAGADVLLLAYNFDEQSIEYIGLSLPNKLPECLASNSALLAVGPREANGIDYVFSNDLACCVTARDPRALKGAIRKLSTDAEYRTSLASRGQRWAFERMNVFDARWRFERVIREAVAARTNREAVAARTPEAVGRERTSTVFLIDPDALDGSGHFMSYNDKLSGALTRLGCEVKVLCNRAIEPAIVRERQDFFPVLSAHSWEIGRGLGPSAEGAARQFEAEVSAAVSELADGEAIIYMYTGSLPHASALARLLERDGSLHSTVNLFWEAAGPSAGGDTKWDRWVSRRWETAKASVSQAESLHLTVPTAQMRDEMRTATGLDCAVAPNPSTTFADAEFAFTDGDAELGASQNSESDLVQGLGVLFPGTDRGAKGYSDSLAAATRIARQTDLRTTIRDLHDSHQAGKGSEAKAALARGVSVVSGALDNGAFFDLFRSNDLVVLPYEPRGFKRRTSGLLIDSIYHGLPVVTTQGTWLGDFVEHYGCGAVVTANAPNKLAGAVYDVVLGNYAESAANSRSAARDHFARNSWHDLGCSIIEAHSIAEHGSSQPSAERATRVAAD